MFAAVNAAQMYEGIRLVDHEGNRFWSAYGYVSRDQLGKDEVVIDCVQSTCWADSLQLYLVQADVSTYAQPGTRSQVIMDAKHGGLSLHNFSATYRQGAVGDANLYTIEYKCADNTAGCFLTDIRLEGYGVDFGLGRDGDNLLVWHVNAYVQAGQTLSFGIYGWATSTATSVHIVDMTTLMGGRVMNGLLFCLMIFIWYNVQMNTNDKINNKVNERLKLSLDEMTAFLKSRGFIFPSSEIYGGLPGVYDYGHYGYLFFQNIKAAWMNSMIRERDDIVALDSAIFMHPTTWKASGHLDSFGDPQIDCRKCKARFRADHVLEDFGINADKATIAFINQELNKLREAKKLVCTNCKSVDLTEARDFNLLVRTNFGSPVGDIKDLPDDQILYPRGETCQGIYLQYKNTIDSMHPKLPFGIAQIGKAFRNEIAAKQFVFRTREFEQMEMQYFFNPKAENQNKYKNITEEIFEYWHQTRWQFYLDYGIDESKLKWHKHDKLAHYASDAYDIEYNYSMLGGFKELEGVHARGDWDLSQHSKFSGVDLSYFEESTKERFVPHIVETSVGVARMGLAFIDNAYTVETVGVETRIVLRLDKRLSPIKVAVLPLFKKEHLQNKAREIWKTLNKMYMCEYDESGSIGKRYRRQDEIGTPYCVTVDYGTVDETSADYDTVTLRDRDSMTQERIKISELAIYIKI